MQFDVLLFNFFHSLADKNNLVDITIVIVGEYLPYIVVLGLIVAMFSKRDSRARFYEMIFVALSVVLARGILMPILKFITDRPRPYTSLTFQPLIGPIESTAFPSGHATFFFAVAMAVLFLNRRWGLWLFVAAAVISFARVIAGVHWPLDIVVGALVGIVSATVVHRFVPKPKAIISPS